MNRLEALGARILADVQARVAGRALRFWPLDPLPGDDAAEGGPTAAAAGRARRGDDATPLQAALANPDIPHGWPVEGRFTGAFGEQRPTHLHAGEDIAAPTGTVVAATAAGRVVVAGAAGTYGNLVEIDHGNGHRTRYAHLSAIGVRVGDQVARGDVVGAVGSTGRSRGPHLHYEVLVRGRAEDPRRFAGETP